MRHQTYHLTPKSLVGERFGADVFGDIHIALVGYCPPPKALDAYAPQRVPDQHFIHVSPDSVRILSHGGRRFLSLAHVYGGPVSSATVEELAYYGIDTILAYGLAGGLGTKNLAMGAFYRVDTAYTFDGTTPHYTGDKIVPAAASGPSSAAYCPISSAATPIRKARLAPCCRRQAPLVSIPWKRPATSSASTSRRWRRAFSHARP